MSELTNTLNIPHAPCIDEVLLDWRSWCNQQPTLERTLDGGLTNKSYLVESRGHHYVVRINAANSRALDLQREIEARVLMFASDAGIGAELVYFDPYECYLVTRYIQGRHWQLSDSQNPDGIKRLASLLKSIHGLEPVEYALDIKIKADHYWRHLNTHTDFSHAIELLRPSVERHIADAYKNNKLPVLCHNDLILENLLCDKQQTLYALDWEYAAMGDPYFDLAVIVEAHELNESESLQLLQSYLNNNPSKQELARLYSNRIIYCYLSVLWYAVKYDARSKGITDDTCRESLTRLQKLLASVS